MKERIKATHFIEVWKNVNEVINTNVFPIDIFDDILGSTKRLEKTDAITIAIFKIKYHEQTSIPIT